ncbi:MAG: hypothetical protein KatS3mg105_2955 [Gemmatales bacterium]|nr:MAG: hypothetical protein KatS3mg105_2955 [Gemmatales bacterium]
MTTTAPASALTLADLESRVARVEPNAILIPPRILRRLIKYDRDVPGLGIQVPHPSCYCCLRQRLLAVLDPDEIGRTDGELANTVLLLARPSESELATLAADRLLRRYWRLLFHASIHRALEEQRRIGKLSDSDVQDRLGALGNEAVEEIQAVLRHERLLLPPVDTAEVYIEFAAVFLEGHYFEPKMLPWWFPNLCEEKGVLELLARDIDAGSLLRQTRLEGASGTEEDFPNEEERPAALPPVRRGDPAKLRLKAERAKAKGNDVRSALLNRRAAESGDADGHRLALDDINRLADRLAKALDLSAEQAEEWRELLPLLLLPATTGIWPQEAKFLYDLQKICIDEERSLYKIDLVGWLCSLGRRPLRRLLPNQAYVLEHKHLTSALKRLTHCRIDNASRQRLAMLLEEASHRCETALRQRFRPLLEQTLDEVDLIPRNIPEQCARNKIIEELLDRVSERGYLTMSELRDALSRNQLKLDDLSGEEELVFGDPLIRADRKLARDLDGVYHGGDIYLRWLQRFSSLAFGTLLGRFFTRYLALPFGGAFVALEGIHHIVAPIERMFSGRETSSYHLATAPATILLGLILFLIINVAPVRRWLWNGTVRALNMMSWLFCELPSILVAQPMIRRIRESRPYRLLKQYFFKPAIWTVFASWIFPLLGADWLQSLWQATWFFVAMAVVLNVRIGRDLEEGIVDFLVRVWHQIHHNIILGSLTFCIDMFRRAVVFVERVCYTVDEWLRFKSGETHLSLAAKALLGIIWSAVAYVVRVFVVLFVEPTFNPIKHFPVVTVAAKLLVPVIPWLGRAVTAPLEPIVGLALAASVAAFVIFFAPGLAGFLVWELKENWKLYKSNRPSRLKPVMIGHHGETMMRLLRRGIHSGTIPKTFDRLRKGFTRGRESAKWSTFRKHRDALGHLEEAVHRFAERELVALLAFHPAWSTSPIVCSRVHLATNCVTITLEKEKEPTPLTIVFSERNGCLAARVQPCDWSSLDDNQRTLLAKALVGFLQLGHVIVEPRSVCQAIHCSAGSWCDGPATDGLGLGWDDWVGWWKV